MEREYDLIVIGSGMGGLTVAGLMAALRGKRVLVIERHFKAGGFTHEFQRGRFHWDVGLHYVGDMAPGSPLRNLFDLVTDGRVEWSPMPDVYDRFLYPGLQFDAARGAKRYVEDLAAQFPDERKAIRRYVRDLRRASLTFQMDSMRRNGSRVARWIGAVGGRLLGHSMQQTTQGYLEKRFRDPRLRAVLASQWGDYGLPPSLSAFPVHALIAQHYMGGAWYPEGGAGEIAKAVRATVERRGGRFLLSREVQEVLVQDGRAAGVRLTNGEEFYAPAVVSNAGSATTYGKLIPKSVEIPFREDLRRFVERAPDATTVGLYLGLRRDPRELGFEGENYWIFNDFDHERTFGERADWVAEAAPRMAYLSFPSLKNPRAQAHTAEILTFSSYGAFARWREQPWLRRDEDYKALKEKISDGLLDLVEKRFPGFKDLVEYRELSTPLTNESMTGHPRGAIYGLPATPERFRPDNAGWTSAQSPVPGLYLTGADVSSLGIVGALMGGVTTLSWLPGGISTPALFRAAARRQKGKPSAPVALQPRPA